MVLNIVALLLVLAITFVQSIFGVFSGMISAFCSLFAALVAFGYYEALNDVVTKQLELHPAYSEPICLIVLFIGVLTGLRYAADNLIRGNVNVPQYVDWIGAGVFGFISAQICVGMAVICTLMLPIGGAVLGFSRYERAEEGTSEHAGMVKWERRALWTRCDEMTVGMVTLVSTGSLSNGSSAFNAVYPDFMDAVYYSTNTVQSTSTPSPFREKVDGFTSGLKVSEWWEQKDALEGRYRKAVPELKAMSPPYERISFAALPGKKLIGVRMTLLPAAADRNKSQRLHLFRPGMLRLVGKNGENYEQYPARVISNADDKIDFVNRIADLDNNFSLNGDSDRFIDAYFEVNDGFTPQFAEYRRHARAAVPAAPAKSIPVALKGGGAPDGSGTVAASDAARQGSGLTFGRIVDGRSGDSIAMPLGVSPTKSKRGQDVTIEGESFAGGRLSGEKSRLEPDSGEGKVERFKAPAGWRLCQIMYKPKQAASLAGQVFNFVGQLQQFKARDDRGSDLELAGYWVKIKRGNNEYYEIFYNGSPDNKVNPTYNWMIDLKDVEQKELRDQDDA